MDYDIKINYVYLNVNLENASYNHVIIADIDRNLNKENKIII